MVFAFYSSFCKCVTRGRKIRRKKKEKRTKKLSQFLKSHISGTHEVISLKCGMWSAEVGEHVHSKNRLVSSRKHRAMEVRKLRFLSFCQYTHGCYAPASWAARHTTVCLDACLEKWRFHGNFIALTNYFMAQENFIFAEAMNNVVKFS